MIKSFGALKVHLKCDYMQVKVSATTLWVMGSSTYTTETSQKVCTLLKVENLHTYKLPISPVCHPKLDLIPLLVEENYHIYHQLVGM